MNQSKLSSSHGKRGFGVLTAIAFLMAGLILSAGPASAGASTVNVTGTMTVSGDFLSAGTVFYTVILTNSGTAIQQDNPGPEFTDVLPAGLSLFFVSANFGTASMSGNTATWDGAIAPGDSITITITAIISATVPTCPNVISNQGLISFDADANGTNESTTLTDDPGTVAANDPTSFTFTHTPVLSATKAETGKPIELHNITYTVVITNSGCGAQPDDPTSPEFSDFLPASLTLISASAVGNPGPGGSTTTDTNSNNVTWNGMIPSGGMVTITITAMVNLGTAGQTITNQGVADRDFNGDGINDSGVLTDDPATPAAGDPTSVVAQAAQLAEVPTLSGLGIAVLALALTSAALLLLRRRRTA
jgi:uncharacterized repeat protein (TIGR01451 family)